MSSEDTEHKELFKRNLSHKSLAQLLEQNELESDQFTYEDGNHELQQFSPVTPKRLTGTTIKFQRVALDAPDGMPLVRQLGFGVCGGVCDGLLGTGGPWWGSWWHLESGFW